MTSIKHKRNYLLYLFLPALFLLSSLQAQTTYQVANHSQLTTAITSAVAGDILNITNNITVTSQVTVNKSVTIEGNGYTISVPVTGLDDLGRVNSSPSGFRVFDITGGVTVNMNNWTIKGGNTNFTPGSSIQVLSGNTLYMNNCVVSNGHTTNNGGGGIYATGTIFLNNCLIRRNAARYGGGFLVRSPGRMYVENSTLAENRSTASNGGGGAGEVGSGAIVYMNNSTLSNNQSTEIGGAINLAWGTMYITNSSVTGNVAYGGSIVTGGGIGNNNGYLYAANTLFAHNYRRTAGSVTNPTAYALDDIIAYNGQNRVYLYNCIHHAAIPAGTNTQDVIAYNGAQDGSDNTIFSGGALSLLTDGSGNEIGTAQIYRPFLYESGVGVAPTLQTGSFLLDPANRGTQTRFDNNNNVNPVVAYYNTTTTTWVNLTGTSAVDDLVTVDQVGDARANPPAVGALEGTVDNLYMLKVNNPSNGTVSGASFYGNVYPSGTQVSLTAIPNSGFEFVRWDYVVGGSGTASTSNPFNVTVDRDITLAAVFSALPGGSYTITYVGNGHTGGTPPAGGTFSAATTISGPNTMVRAGYTFLGWNTASGGTGTSYAGGDSYSAGSNLVLYAQWEPYAVWTGNTSSDWNTNGNWLANVVPSSGDPVNIPAGRPNYPVLTGDVIVGDLLLDGNIDTDGNTITIGTSTAAPGTLTYQSGHIIGNLRRWFAAATNSGPETGLFPLGDGVNNRFMTVEYTSAPASGGSILAQYRQEAGGTDGFPLNNVTAVGACLSFDVRRIYPTGFWRGTAENGLLGGNYDISLVGHNLDLAILCSITAIKRDSELDPWEQNGSHVEVTGSLDSAIVRRTGASGWSDWAFGGRDDAFFPVSWLYFSATPDREQQNVTLDWATGMEEQHSHFEVERSSDLRDWATIGSINGQGSSGNGATYHWIDTEPKLVNYYRLRSVDMDGSFSYSDVQEATFDPAAFRALAKVYPNPSLGDVTIEYPGECTYQVFDLRGRLLAEGSVNQSTTLNGLGRGVYLISLRGDAGMANQRLIVTE